MTPADLIALLRDALRLWGTHGHVAAGEDHVAVTHNGQTYRITRGPAPTRWFLQTPQREAAGRPPRPAPSITALLSALRAALGLPRGTPARIGAASLPADHNPGNTRQS
jgi:hypothetical protein